jgi:hypothetical protein
MFYEAGAPSSIDQPNGIQLQKIHSGITRHNMNGNGNGNGNGALVNGGCNCPQPQSLMGNQNLVIWIAIGLALVYLVKK